MISDNGSAFTAVETQEFASARGIDWKFSVPHSPWMGGIWERLVSCVKKCLKRAIGLKQVTFVELQTLIFEIETILNNRPICNDYDDDLNEVLTPNHMIFGRRIENCNFRNFLHVEEKLTKRERHLANLRTYFWSVWRNEYLTSLRATHNSGKVGPEKIAQNDIVLIYDKSLPRHLWKLGRVVKVLRSKDGIVRAADVKCGSTGIVVTRPLSRLYPIERCNEPPSSSTENSTNTKERIRRSAAVKGEAKRKLGSNIGNC